MAASLSVRNAEHAGFGRIELELPEGMTAMAAQQGDRISIRFLSGAPFDPINPGLLATRNRRSSVTLADGIDLTMVHGARLKVTRLNDRLVLDLWDPLRPLETPGVHWPAPAVSGMRLEASPATVTVVASSPETKVAPMPVSPPAAPVPPAPTGAADRAVVPEPSEAVAPMAPAREVTRSELPAPQKSPPTPFALAATITGTVFSLPFLIGTGAASFTRGEWSYVVFDERRPIDLSRQREDTVFASATMLLLPDATLLRFKADAGVNLSLVHDGLDWRITLDGGRPHSLKPRLVEEGLLLPAADVGRVVAIPDPDGGGTLLIGTLRQMGEAVPVMRRATAFTMWPTWLGVVVEPALDTTQMRAVPDGFLLTAGVGRSLGLSDAFSAADPAEATGDPSRQLVLPALPADMLLARLRDASLAASVAPAQSRTDKRLAVAQSLLALGMGAEAQGVTAAVARDDPRASARLDLIAVAAVGALLAGRVAEADGIMDQRLPDTDEVEFWRGIRAAMTNPDSRAAAILALRIGLLASYPAPLRDRLTALASETLAAGQQGAALDTLGKALPDDGHFGLARAMMVESGTPSLAALDLLAHGSDRRTRARAAQLAAETRLTRGLVDAAGTADALERLLYAWRDDRSEIALRERVAELRARSGAPRPAMALLRETSRLWPEQAPRLRQLMSGMLAAAIAPDAQPSLAPLAFVAIVEENGDLLPVGLAGEHLAKMLADRLDALDLTERTATVLGRLTALAPPGAARATLGGRLARSRLAENDAPGALAALRDSEAPGLATALWEARELLRAQAQAAQNDRAAALRTVASLTSAAASVFRATLLEQGRDWVGAGQALDSVLNAIPSVGPLDEAQARILLRTASDAAQAGDGVKLQRLQQQFRDRMPRPDLASVFALLTVAPVREVADLARAGREVALARQLPARLDGIES